MHPTHVAAVPDGFKHRVTETRNEDVLHLLVAQEVIDAEYLVLTQLGGQSTVKFLRRLQITAERLLHHHARVLCEVMM